MSDHKKTNLLIGSLCVLLFAYVFVRSIVLSITWDESYTFLYHVIRDKFIQDEFDTMGANHHLLNVWGMWVSYKIFGSSEWALRLPNVLAFGIYLFASARLALRVPGPLLAVASIVLLCMHPYLLDFFSLAGTVWLMLGCF